MEGVHFLRTIEDAVAIRDSIGPGRSIIIIGAGFIGAELAASALELGTEVTVIEAAALPLGRLLPPVISSFYRDVHAVHGVAFDFGTSVEAITREGGVIRALTSDGISHAADQMVVAIGIVPNVELAARAGLAVNDGVLVDEQCRTSAQDVFAAGDVTNHPNSIFRTRLRVEHWQSAQHQGMTAAKNMVGRPHAFAEVPWVWSEQYDLNLQIVGLPRSSDEVVVRGEMDKHEFTAFLLRDGALVGAIGVNRAMDIRAVRVLLERGCRPDPRHLADESVDLASLQAAPQVV